MKPLLFRFKIASLSLLTSGILVVGFGVFFLVTIGRVGMARIDDEIRALGEAQVRARQPTTHWTNFDSSLRFIYGDRAEQRFAVRVLNATNAVLYASDHWPADLADIVIPELSRAPGPAFEHHHTPAARPDVRGPGDEPDREGSPAPGRHFISRLDRDGDNRVSVTEFDGPRHHFYEFDSDGDGYIVESEARRPPPRQERPEGHGPPGDHREHGRRHPEPREFQGDRRPPRPRPPIFRTYGPATGGWRVGFMGNESVTLVIAADLSELRREAAFFRNAFLIVTPVALLVLAIVGWVIASRALRPVAIITRTAEAITARGLGRRVPATSADAELQRLADVINRMLARLERSFHQAARFSADAAHELQTPLTVLQGELDNAVQQAVAGSEEQQRYSGLLEEVRVLKAVVQKLLLLARADVGQLPLSRSDVDLSELIRSAVEDVEAMAGGQLTLDVNVPAGIQASVDADLIGQVLRNMTSNAVKYNREGGSIRFDLKVMDATILFTLANTGTAIPEDDRERVFARFYRVDKARSRQIRGSGLGLDLAREIARAHGGDLVLDPHEEGMISFTLTLPSDPSQDLCRAD